MSAELPLSEGFVAVPSFRSTLRRLRMRSEAFLRESKAAAPLSVPLRAGLGLVRRLRG